ncbi:SDR family NAD(P)-dependent oxidoreductase [Mycobacteroides abscessus]
MDRAATDASRGIGAEAARQLASPDTYVLVSYREKTKRAQTIAEGISAAGGHASIVQADLSKMIRNAMRCSQIFSNSTEGLMCWQSTHLAGWN